MMMSHDNRQSNLHRPTETRPDLIIPWVVEFRIVGTPDIVRAPIAESMMIGRRDEEADFTPEVDLTDYNAIDFGVSRRHAQLHARDNRVTIEDLGSSNGTYINDKQIPVYRPKRIHKGDKIRLGKMQLQVHFAVQPSVDEETIRGIGNNIDIPKLATGQRLLVLDDSRDVCHVVRYIAEEAGFTVKVAHTMRDAISYMDEHAVAGLITELLLPDGNGIDLMHYVQRNINADLPVLATGATGMEQAIDTGAQMFLPKPIAVDQLITGLKKMVQLMA